MNAGEFFERVAELERAHAAFAVATVVDRRRARQFASRRPRDRSRGRAYGGVRRRRVLARHRAAPSRRAIRAGSRGSCRSIPAACPHARATTIRDLIVVPMGCASEGAVDVYIEPHLPPRRLIVVGFTPVADAARPLGLVARRTTSCASCRDDELGDIPDRRAFERSRSVALAELPRGVGSGRARAGGRGRRVAGPLR